jgi:hypothetical protein
MDMDGIVHSPRRKTTPFSVIFTFEDMVMKEKNYIWILVVLVAVIWFFSQTNSKNLPTEASSQTATKAQPRYSRPSTAPNGVPWPVSAGYIQGYDLLHSNGLLMVTVDNSKNDSDVFVKLVALDAARVYPVRQFYIPAFSRFALESVSPGNYDIRYRDLGNGHLSRSESFQLEEISTYSGTQYSTITMTLYKVQNGNMQTYGLSESEF